MAKYMDKLADKILYIYTNWNCK